MSTRGTVYYVAAGLAGRYPAFDQPRRTVKGAELVGLRYVGFLTTCPSSGAQQPRCARLQGFSLHANIAVPAHARGALEHLCRYLLRPALALERLTENSNGPPSVPVSMEKLLPMSLD